MYAHQDGHPELDEEADENPSLEQLLAQVLVDPREPKENADDDQEDDRRLAYVDGRVVHCESHRAHVHGEPVGEALDCGHDPRERRRVGSGRCGGRLGRGGGRVRRGLQNQRYRHAQVISKGDKSAHGELAEGRDSCSRPRQKRPNRRDRATGLRRVSTYIAAQHLPV